MDTDIVRWSPGVGQQLGAGKGRKKMGDICNIVDNKNTFKKIPPYQLFCEVHVYPFLISFVNSDIQLDYFESHLFCIIWGSLGLWDGCRLGVFLGFELHECCEPRCKNSFIDKSTSNRAEGEDQEKGDTASVGKNQEVINRTSRNLRLGCRWRWLSLSRTQRHSKEEGRAETAKCAGGWNGNQRL